MTHRRNHETNTARLEALPDVMSREQFARALGLHKATVRRWELAGRVKPIRLSSKSVRYSRVELERVLKEAQA